MPRKKRKCFETIARKTAAKRKQETPEERAARLESMRNYARHYRANETESHREERLNSMRCYARRIRQQENAKMRQQKLALITERSKYVHDVDPPKEPEVIYFTEIDIPPN